VTRATLPVTAIRGMVGTQVSGVPVPPALIMIRIEEAVTEIPLRFYSAHLRFFSMHAPPLHFPAPAPAPAQRLSPSPGAGPLRMRNRR
jgi:hypothetical protein